MIRLTVVVIGLSVISLMFAGISAARIDPETASGVWLLDEARGEVAGDSSENNNDGNLENGPKWVEGKFEKGLEFDGKDDYLEVPDTESLDLTDKITIVGWVYPNFYGQSESKDPIAGDGSSANILSKMVDQASYIGPFWWEYRNHGNLNAYFAAIPANTYLTPTIPNLLTDKWSHIASTYDSSTGIAQVYLDGGVVDTKSNANFGPLRAGVQLVFGTGKGGGTYGNYFNGIIDDFAVFNVALTADDINEIMTVLSLIV